MDQTAAAVAAAASFVWLGMVLAISFLEAPLKFRAPGVTIPLGLGIGRVVFRALNTAEVVWAIAIVVASVLGGFPAPVAVLTGAVCLVLVVQLVLLRPRLARRSDRVLAGEDVPRSRAHHAYVALEVVKVLALVALGVTALAR
ncbi:hypothetical protein [Amycolatopsis sp. CA-230715]|uniref:hypothetical protein n=1 Tax=Amycolatopsis sp. CA-230715 TaxID=2745196 RepID=UPI001C01E066|nr:hypothetical protein [Amycolatopsis sp. CA-230715]QWF84474.1 hypothetical protein HUW46_07924 [Amycolatopsis sp. CA-230715]